MRKMLALLLLMATCYGQAPVLAPIADYPTLVDFVDHAVLYELPSQWKAARTPRGWEINWLDEDGNWQLTLLYDRVKQSYVPLGRPKATSHAAYRERLRESVLKYAKFGHEQQLYFGYATWPQDVIATLTANPQTEASLEQLARAHHALAQGVLNDQTGEGLRFDFATQNPDGSYTAEAVQHFYTHVDRGLGYLQQLQKQYPQYTTLVGGIGTKLACDLVWAGLYADVYLHDAERAESYIRRARFTPMHLTVARQQLAAAAPNSYLFTTGDIGLFPHLYLQYAEGYRRDVRLLDLSLMNLSHYLVATSTGRGFGPKLLLDVPVDSLCGEMAWQRELPTDSVAIAGSRGTHYLHFEADMGAAWTPRQHALLSMARRNSALGWPHPIQLSVMVDEAAITPFVPHRVQKGLIYTLDYDAPDKLGVAYIDSLLRSLTPDMLAGGNPPDAGAKSMASLYHTLGYRLALHHQEARHHKQAAEVLRMVAAAVPYPLGAPDALDYAEIYGKLNDPIGQASAEKAYVQDLQYLKAQPKANAGMVSYCLYKGIVYYGKNNQMDEARSLLKQYGPWLKMNGQEEMLEYLTGMTE